MADKMTWTAERLQALFDEYNEKYWLGTLPKYDIKISNSRESGDRIWGFCVREGLRISINILAHHTEDEVTSTLLHEMTHAAIGVGHKQDFLNELQRLIQAGATQLQWEFDFYQKGSEGGSH